MEKLSKKKQQTNKPGKEKKKKQVHVSNTLVKITLKLLLLKYYA
jgi:hypothetical protein